MMIMEKKGTGFRKGKSKKLERLILLGNVVTYSN